MKRLALGLFSILACGPKQDAASPPKEEVEERVVIEKLPDGSTKKTTIRTTRRQVPAPDPPPRPADSYPANEPLVRYNVERVNAYRAQHGLGALLYDAKISEFAKRGSEQYSRDHTAHAHFAANAKGAPGFGSVAAENQGDPNGVSALDSDPIKNGKAQIDLMLKLMMDEGPGGGHYENIVNPRFRRIGIGLVYVSGKLYLTNDVTN